MRRLTVFNSVTLDGVMQGPGHRDEDRRDGFEHGGWAAPYSDAVIGQVAGEGMARGGALLFGRRTYEDLYSAWAGRTDNPFSGPLTEAQKYVVTTTFKEPLPWSNSTLINGDVAATVRGLKTDSGADIVILGSGDLIQELLAHELIDEFLLMIHPLVLGSGRRLLRDGGPYATFRLVETRTSTTGVIIATFQPGPPPKPAG